MKAPGSPNKSTITLTATVDVRAALTCIKSVGMFGFFAVAVMVQLRNSQCDLSKIAEQMKELTMENSKDAIVVDDLVWYNGRPKTSPTVGWEDDWMIRWKEENYDPKQRIGCKSYHEVATPYESEMLCTVPAYIPARLPKQTNPATNATKIPRVIFISWMTRDIGPKMYTSVLSLLNFNPEYELIFFVDDDIDQFMCDNYPIDTNNTASSSITSEFSILKSGASRVDVWRMMMIQRYGGVYLDIDMSSLGPLPIRNEIDTAFSGIGGWGHSPNKLGGVLEHWALAYIPNHPLIDATIQQIRWNLRNWKEYDKGGKYWVDEDDYSFTVSLTGPGPYQKALHDLLAKTGCKRAEEEDGTESESWKETMEDPKRYCGEHYSDFIKTFGTNFVITKLNFNSSVALKLLDYDSDTEVLGKHYDYDGYMPGPVDPNFCSSKSFRQRRQAFEKRWKKALEGSDSNDGDVDV